MDYPELFMKSESKRKCLIILGMHRSGTSALAGALALAGLNPGKKAFDPGEDNPKGYFENARITLINEQILYELFARWNETLFIPEEWWLFEKFDKYLQQISEIILDEFDEADSILIKDPRLSVLLPLYLNALRKLDVNPVFVICVRNPFEITDSLKKRNHLAQEKSLLLWMDYQVKAEYYTRNYPRVFLSYHSLLKDPVKILRTLQEKLQPGIILNPETVKAVLSFLDNELKHHDFEDQLPENVHLPQLKELYNLLEKTDLRDLTNQELTTVDDLRSLFFERSRFFNGLPKIPEAVLEVHFENNEKVVLKMPVKYGNNELAFPINPGNPVIKMIFKPANSWVGLRILKIEVSDPGQGFLIIDDLVTNSSLPVKDDLLIFETEMPEIIIEFQSPKTISHIVFTLAYLAFGRVTDRILINRSTDIIESLQSQLQLVYKQLENQNNELLELRQHIEYQSNEILKLEQLVKNQNRDIEEKGKIINDLRQSLYQLEFQIDRIYTSISWRIGRIITAPARFFYNLLRK